MTPRIPISIRTSRDRVTIMCTDDAYRVVLFKVEAGVDIVIIEADGEGVTRVRLDGQAHSIKQITEIEWEVRYYE